MSGRDFYEIQHEGERLTLPRVTSILGIIDKSGPLMGWAVNVERAAIKAALEEVLTLPGAAFSPQAVWDEMQRHLSGKRASLRRQDDAANIGLAAHQWIEWYTSKMLGLPVESEPKIPDEAMQAVSAWLEWKEVVGFTPLVTEAILYCPRCGYAGTCDTIAKVAGVVTVIDYKTAKAIYPEALLQVNFYKHATPSIGMVVEQAMVVRLPKVVGDPKPEMRVAPEVPIRLLQGILTTWRTMKWITQEPYGSAPLGGKMCAA